MRPSINTGGPRKDKDHLYSADRRITQGRVAAGLVIQSLKTTHEVRLMDLTHRNIQYGHSLSNTTEKLNLARIKTQKLHDTDIRSEKKHNPVS